MNRRAFLRASAALAALLAAPARAARPGFDPLQAKRLGAVDAALKLSRAQKAKLAENGFAVLADQRAPSFGTAYEQIYDALVAYARVGAGVIDGLAIPEDTRAPLAAHFARLEEASTTLGEMARRQLAGEPFTRAQMRFINEAIRSRYEGCGELTGAEGWYAELFLESLRAMEYDPTIADVHTQPSDEEGDTVGRVLHVGCARPRLAVFTVDTCGEVRAYVGAVSAYREVITEGFDRLDDMRWMRMEDDSAPPTWAADLEA